LGPQSEEIEKAGEIRPFYFMDLALVQFADVLHSESRGIAETLQAARPP
jgi:hypothetical protein